MSYMDRVCVFDTKPYLRERDEPSPSPPTSLDLSGCTLPENRKEWIRLLLASGLLHLSRIDVGPYDARLEWCSRNKPSEGLRTITATIYHDSCDIGWSYWETGRVYGGSLEIFECPNWERLAEQAIRYAARLHHWRKR